MADVRVPLVDAMLEESPWCELGPLWATAFPGHECWRYATGLHEIRKRSAGGSLTNRANLLRSCNPCNELVENQPVVARALGLVVRRGDARWDELEADRP